MENPFLRRASEHIPDVEAYLAVISPEPVKTFLNPYGKSGVLYDRLVLLRGTPGSGKTTLARLFDYSTLTALVNKSEVPGFRSLLATLSECGAISDFRPAVMSCRLNMESDYRRIWNFPYPDEVKLRLTAALIQARAVLAWLRHLKDFGHLLGEISIIPRDSSVAATEAIGGIEGAAIHEQARQVEREIYSIVAALLPPDLEHLPSKVMEAYQPFDVIQAFELKQASTVPVVSFSLRPLVILDDAHLLHPEQLKSTQRWLARRELPVSRWILSRLDIMHLDEALKAFMRTTVEEDLPGITKPRDVLEIMLQNTGEDRSKARKQFRSMAKDMANRYLSQMELFNSRRLNSLADLLEDECDPLSASKTRELENSLSSIQKRSYISEDRRQTFQQEIRHYADSKSGSLPDDIQLVMESILMHRYINRVPQRTLSETDEDPEPSRPLKADSAVFEAAKLHLLHRYNRPFFYGMDSLSDAASENAEQFLHLAAKLVEALATQIVRRRARLRLDARTQNDLMRQSAGNIIDSWNFPQCKSVRTLVESIAAICLKESLKPNAWIGSGANAYGVLQEEFNGIVSSYRDLANIIHFGLSYNAFLLVPEYPCKGKKWCLLELGGLPILRYGLTLHRGGFIEGSLSELNQMSRSK